MINLLKKLPYPIFMKLYFHYFKLIKKEHLKILSKQFNYQILDKSKLQPLKKSNKLFIMGSGYSINKITGEEWKHINNNDILGFNFSFLNKDHIPTYYTCEAYPAINLNEDGRSEYAEYFFQLYKDFKNDYKDLPKFLTDLRPERQDHFENYGRDLMESNFYLANTVNGLSSNTKDFKKLLDYYKKKGFFQDRKELEPFFKFRATLTLAVSFGVQMGYDEIILCGVDLNDTRYFYQDKERYPHLPYFQASPKTEKHVTIMHRDNYISIDDALKLMKSIILNPKKIKLTVQNPKSELIKFLDVYKFE